MNIKSSWDFVERYFPDYSSSDNICRALDLMLLKEKQDLSIEQDEELTYLLEDIYVQSINKYIEQEQIKTQYLLSFKGTPIAIIKKESEYPHEFYMNVKKAILEHYKIAERVNIFTTTTYDEFFFSAEIVFKEEAKIIEEFKLTKLKTY